MNKLPILLLSLFVTFGCISETKNAGAYSATTSTVPNLNSRVNDYAAILTVSEEDKLNELLKSLEDSIGSQLVILTIESLEGRTIEEYSMDVVENSTIGREKYKDGILITLALTDRKVRIEVGYGLELIVKDEIAKKIIDSIMVPEFQEQKYNEGLTNASKEIISLIYKNPKLVGILWEPKKTGTSRHN